MRYALIALLALVGCASSPAKDKPQIPTSMQPNHGMTGAKAAGFGDAAKFMK